MIYIYKSKLFTAMAKQKPPGKKVIRYKNVQLPDRVVQKGKPAEVTMTAERGTQREVYTPSKIETGHKSYGKPGGGTDPEMNRLLDKAVAEKKTVTDYSSKGLHYRAGRNVTTSESPKFATSIKVTPDLRLKQSKQVPVYEEASTSTRTPAKIKSSTGPFGKDRAEPLPWIKGKTGPEGLRATKKIRYRKVAKKNLGLRNKF